MIDLHAGAPASKTSLSIQQHRRLTRLASVVAAFAVATLGGCSLVQPGVALKSSKHATPAPAVSKSQPASAGTAGAKVTPADVMFQSTDGPLPQRASTVNVFGEVDGVAPSPFASAGSSAGLQQHTFLDEGYDADPSVSPDGKWLVFSSTRHSEQPDIYLQRADGLAVTQITADESDDAYPQFSRDGKQIAFASNRSGNWDIYVMDADGNRVRQLTRTPAQELHPTFSPDGNRVAYSALGTRSGQWELWTLDLRTAERRMIGHGLFPNWSPRGERDVIAFQRARQRGTRWFSAWTLELVNGEAREITEVAYSGTNAIVGPTWSADGTRIAFCTIADPDANATEKKNARSRTGTPAQDIWTINADGTHRTRITDGRGVNAMPTWARDGRIYFVSDRAGAESIWSAATAEPTQAVEPSPESAMTGVPDPFTIAPVATDTVPPAQEPSAPAGSGQAHAE
jgi:TolB protein